MKRLLCTGVVKRFRSDNRLIKPKIVVHGGVGDDFNNAIKEMKYGVKLAAALGYDVLIENESVVDAVHHSVRVLELFSWVNAFREPRITPGDTKGFDASIMRGCDMKSGEVTGLKEICHPVSAARLVMERTNLKHILGRNVERLAAEQDCDMKNDDILNITKSLQDPDLIKVKIPASWGHKYGPIGAVAIDIYGNIAAASFGGIIGSGIYADNLCGGVSVGGYTEKIKSHKIASKILAMIQIQELSAQEATSKVLQSIKSRFKTSAGAVSIDTRGDVGVHFTTTYMPWAFREENVLHYGFEEDEEEVAIVECVTEE